MEVQEKDVVTALVHLYRGELGRMTSYRVRLDTTTNWAVGTTAAITTFALGSSTVPHFVFGLPFALVLLFLWMEATRYRVYETVRQRVRLLEQGFYVELLSQKAIGDWRERLTAELAKPQLPIGYLAACAVRLRRSYLWLVAIIFLSWLVKLDLVGELPSAAAIGFLPGWLVVGLVLLQFVPLIVIALTYSAREEG